MTGGYIENPTGNGGGRGATEVLGATNARGRAAPRRSKCTAEKLPWPLELTEAESGVIRQKSKGVAVRVRCGMPAAGKEPETVLFSVAFTGEWTPSTHNGASRGKPFTDEFGEGSGELVSEIGAGKTTGKLKVLGYEQQEVAQRRLRPTRLTRDSRPCGERGGPASAA